MARETYQFSYRVEYRGGGHSLERNVAPLGNCKKSFDMLIKALHARNTLHAVESIRRTN